jgi:hypothetical protein
MSLLLSVGLLGASVFRCCVGMGAGLWLLITCSVAASTAASRAWCRRDAGDIGNLRNHGRTMRADLVNALLAIFCCSLSSCLTVSILPLMSPGGPAQLCT